MGYAGCCCGCSSDRDVDGKSFNSSNNEMIVIDRHYGCSEAGALVAVIMILVLIIGAIASTIFIKDINLVLICSVISLVIVFIIFVIYCSWQRMNVRRQRAKYGRPYDVDRRQRVNGHLYTSVPTSTSTRTSWLFWSSKKNAIQIPVSPTATTTTELQPSPLFMPHRVYHVQKPPRQAYSTVV